MKIHSRIKHRVDEEIKLLLIKDLTIREISSITKVSKSTVHKDLTDYTKELYPDKLLAVSTRLEEHKHPTYRVTRVRRPYTD